MQNTFRLINSDKFKNMLKISVVSFILSIIVKEIMSRAGLFEWIQINNIAYYGILLVSLWMYSTSFPKRNWFHAITIAMIPVSALIVALNPIRVYGWLYLTIGVVIFVAVDLWAVDGNLRNLWVHHRKALCRYIWQSMLTNLGGALVVVGAIIFFSFVKVMGETEVNAVASPYLQEEILISATNMRDLNSETPDHLWDSNKDSLVMLSKDKYSALTLEQKMFALQELINIECEYLGIEPIQVVGMNIKQYGLGGFYWAGDRRIAIEISYVEEEESLTALGILLHEVYHGYEYECAQVYEKVKDDVNCDLIVFREYEKWSDEFGAYYTVDQAKKLGDITLYENQEVEKAANTYRDKWLGPYWNYINSIED